MGTMCQEFKPFKPKGTHDRTGGLRDGIQSTVANTAVKHVVSKY